MGALWSGTKLADIFGSMILLSTQIKKKRRDGSDVNVNVKMTNAEKKKKLKKDLFQKKESEQEGWSHPPDPQ